MIFRFLLCSVIEGGMWAEGVSEQGSEEDIRGKLDEITGEWGRPHNEELNDLYYLPNIIRVIKSSRMR